MLFCEDCRWCDTEGDKKPTWWKCRAPQNKRESPLARDNGQQHWIYCESMRDFNCLEAVLCHGCGRSARWFQPKGRSASNEGDG